MILSRILLLVAAISLTGFADVANADSHHVVKIDKYQQRLLGKWTSSNGDVMFASNGMMIYKGKRRFCAIADGTIQVSIKAYYVMLPYHFLDDKLVITDHGVETVYTRVK